MKKFLLTLLVAILSLPAFALYYDFEYTYEGQTLRYKILDEEAKTCETAYQNWAIKGDLIIPSIAICDNKKYTVIGIGQDAFA